VSFNEYLITIQNLCNEIKDFLLDNHTNYTNIYFGGYGNISKSYTWVLFIFLNEMSAFFRDNDEITNKIFIGEGYLPNSSGNKNKYLYLFFDDMAYSGSQMLGSIPEYRNNINVDIYITTPFISEIAKQRVLAKHSMVNFWENIVQVPSLKSSFMKSIPEVLTNKYLTLFRDICENIPNDFFNAYQCYGDMIPIYFDHKIADGMSTFQKLLNFGSYPIQEGCTTCFRIPLIKKCIDTNIRLNPDKSYCTDMLGDIDDNDTCPATFYKKIIYNFATDTELIPKYTKLSLVNVIMYYDSIGKFSVENYQQKYLKYKMKYLKLKKLQV
jgi:hypothetical protein